MKQPYTCIKDHGEGEQSRYLFTIFRFGISTDPQGNPLFFSFRLVTFRGANTFHGPFGWIFLYPVNPENKNPRSFQKTHISFKSFTGQDQHFCLTMVLGLWVKEDNQPHHQQKHPRPLNLHSKYTQATMDKVSPCRNEMMYK